MVQLVPVGNVIAWVDQHLEHALEALGLFSYRPEQAGQKARPVRDCWDTDGQDHRGLAMWWEAETKTCLHPMNRLTIHRPQYLQVISATLLTPSTFQSLSSPRLSS